MAAEDTLIVCALEARDLPNTDEWDDQIDPMTGVAAPDPFVAVSVAGGPLRFGPIELDSVNPAWHACLTYMGNFTESTPIQLVVVDTDMRNADDVLGSACTNSSTGVRWLELVSEPRPSWSSWSSPNRWGPSFLRVQVVLLPVESTTEDLGMVSVSSHPPPSSSLPPQPPSVPRQHPSDGGTFAAATAASHQMEMSSAAPRPSAPSAKESGLAEGSGDSGVGCPAGTSIAGCACWSDTPPGCIGAFLRVDPTTGREACVPVTHHLSDEQRAFLTLLQQAGDEESGGAAAPPQQAVSASARCIPRPSAAAPPPPPPSPTSEGLVMCPEGETMLSCTLQQGLQPTPPPQQVQPPSPAPHQHGPTRKPFGSGGVRVVDSVCEPRHKPTQSAPSSVSAAAVSAVSSLPLGARPMELASAAAAAAAPSQAGLGFGDVGKSDALPIYWAQTRCANLLATPPSDSPPQQQQTPPPPLLPQSPAALSRRSQPPPPSPPSPSSQPPPLASSAAASPARQRDAITLQVQSPSLGAWGSRSAVVRCPPPFELSGCECFSRHGLCVGARFQEASDGSGALCNVSYVWPQVWWHQGASAVAQCVWVGTRPVAEAAPGPTTTMTTTTAAAATTTATAQLAPMACPLLDDATARTLIDEAKTLQPYLPPGWREALPKALAASYLGGAGTVGTGVEWADAPPSDGVAGVAGGAPPLTEAQLMASVVCSMVLLVLPLPALVRLLHWRRLIRARARSAAAAAEEEIEEEAAGADRQGAAAEAATANEAVEAQEAWGLVDNWLELAEGGGRDDAADVGIFGLAEGASTAAPLRGAAVINAIEQTLPRTLRCTCLLLALYLFGRGRGVRCVIFAAAMALLPLGMLWVPLSARVAPDGVTPASENVDALNSILMVLNGLVAILALSWCRGARWACADRRGCLPALHVCTTLLLAGGLIFAEMLRYMEVCVAPQTSAASLYSLQYSVSAAPAAEVGVEDDGLAELSGGGGRGAGGGGGGGGGDGDEGDDAGLCSGAGPAWGFLFVAGRRRSGRGRAVDHPEVIARVIQRR